MLLKYKVDCVVDSLIEWLTTSVMGCFPSSLLVKIASGTSWRCAIALEKLTKQAELARVAIEGKERTARERAVEKLTDQPALAKVATETDDIFVYTLVLEKLTDQALLAKVAVEASRWNVRYKAVEKLTDKAVLARVAVEDGDQAVRMAALEKLTDQAVLAKVAVDDGHEAVRRTAVEKLTDQAVLAKVAVEDGHEVVREAAVAKLTDQAVLAKVAVEDGHEVVREAAMAKLTDQAVLVSVAIEAKDQSARYGAVKKVTDQAVLARVAVEDGDQAVRRAAVEKLTDQAVLAKVAVEDGHEVVRRTAVEKLTDRAVLAKLAAVNDADHVHWAATVRLARLGDDQGLRLLIGALTNPNKSVRRQAAFDLVRVGHASSAKPLIAAYQDIDVRLGVNDAIRRFASDGRMEFSRQLKRDLDAHYAGHSELVPAGRTEECVRLYAEVVSQSGFDPYDIETSVGALCWVHRHYGGFLEPGGKEAARVIGELLNDTGGKKLMQTVWRGIVEAPAGKLGMKPHQVPDRELDFAWNGIGTWQA